MSETPKNAEKTALLDLKELFSGRETKVTFDRSFPLSYSFADVETCGDVRVCGTLSDYSGVFQFQADFTVPYTAQCARCLETVTCNLEFSLDRPVSSEEKEEEEVVCVKEDIIDLSDLCLTGMVENFPVKHLCSEDCKGLCPYCGTDLNRASCSCKKPPDPRLAGLAEFFNE